MIQVCRDIQVMFVVSNFGSTVLRAHAHLAFAFAMHLASIVFNGTRHT